MFLAIQSQRRGSTNSVNSDVEEETEHEPPEEPLKSRVRRGAIYNSKVREHVHCRAHHVNLTLITFHGYYCL